MPLSFNRFNLGKDPGWQRIHANVFVTSGTSGATSPHHNSNGVLKQRNNTNIVLSLSSLSA